MKEDTKELIAALSSGPVQKYIEDHKNDDIRKIILKNKVILGIPTAHLLDQISTRRKAQNKLPLYYNTPGIIYPRQEYLEQSSSEQTARFKAEIISSFAGHSVFTGADLTGGYGVDTFFISRVVTKIHYIEPDNALLDLAAHSHSLLGAWNIEYHATIAEEFLKTPGPVDFIFVDPSRRTEAKRKVLHLEDSQPDVVQLASQIFLKTKLLIIKASPLFDIQAGLSKIPFVTEVYVVSVNNECKELLFVSEEGKQITPQIKAVNIQDNEERQNFSFTLSEEQSQQITFGEPLEYLYEPNASILKAGAFRTIATRFDLQKIHPSTHLYTAENALDSFPGRAFRIEALVRPDPEQLKKYFPDRKANVTTRNYPLTPDELKKKTGLKDGGEKFLIGFGSQKKKYLAVAARLRPEL